MPSTYRNWLPLTLSRVQLIRSNTGDWYEIILLNELFRINKLKCLISFRALALTVFIIIVHLSYILIELLRHLNYLCVVCSEALPFCVQADNLTSLSPLR